MKQIGKYYFIDNKQPLNKGGSGTVYKGYYQQSKDQQPFWVAIKELRRFYNGNYENLQFDQEITATKQIMKKKSEFLSNIVQVYDIFPSKDEADVYYIVMDLYVKDLDDYKREKGGKIESSNVLKIIREIALGIKALHDCEIAHRNIKPDTIFLSLIQLPNGAEGYVYKVGDYDIGKDKSQLTSKVGTISYMAPDMLDFSKMEYTNKVDIWALGVMTHELLTGTILYNGKNPNLVRSYILQSPPYKMWYKQSFNKVQKDSIDRSFQFIDHECIVDLIDQMLEKDPQKRKNIDEIIALIEKAITKYAEFQENNGMNRLQPQSPQQIANSQNRVFNQNKQFIQPNNTSVNNSNHNHVNKELISLKQTVQEQKQLLEDSQLIIKDKCDTIYQEQLKNKLIEQENIELKKQLQEMVKQNEELKIYKSKIDEAYKQEQNKLVEMKKHFSTKLFNNQIISPNFKKKLKTFNPFKKIEDINQKKQNIVKLQMDELEKQIKEF